MSHCLLGRPARDIWERGGPGRGGRSRGTAWVAWRCRQCQVARCLSSREGVPAVGASFATSPQGGRRCGRRDGVPPGPRQLRLLRPGPRAHASRARAQSRLLGCPGGGGRSPEHSAQRAREDADSALESRGARARSGPRGRVGGKRVRVQVAAPGTALGRGRRGSGLRWGGCVPEAGDSRFFVASFKIKCSDSVRSFR